MNVARPPLASAAKTQRWAARPGASAWLTANAGSGKTRVLTDRVARLLLTGADPSTILCLTYTKAAAGEMQNRLFARLGAWAMMDDGALTDALAALGDPGPFAPGALDLARTLFARAVETPGGLRIQTIHALCAALLRRFPIEAGVPPGFVEIDEQTARNQVMDCLEVLAAGPGGAEIDTVARHLTGDGLTDLALAVVAARGSFGGAEVGPRLRATLGLTPELTAEALAARVCGDDPGPWLADLCTAFEAGKATDQSAAAKLRPLCAGPFDAAALERLEDALLTRDGRPKSTPPTKAVRDALPDADNFDEFARRLADARPLRLALAVLDRSLALHAFGERLLPAYAQAKARRGWVDFDDLIDGARRLLSDPARAAWVLYKLDGRIAHLLVDEAQDTAPAQWEVIERLTAEFTAGDGIGGDRTLFVVGDRKQSIYSFQGADVVRFDRVREAFRDRFRAAGLGLDAMQLAHSFRSAPAILAAVDHTLDAAPEATRDARHLAVHEAQPGRVDLWPLIPKADAPPDRDWADPSDAPAPDAEETVLARRIAGEVARMTRGEAIRGKDGPRLLAPGDVLILVQRRNALFDALIATCKAEGLPVAGADRLRLGDELAVKDILALCAFLALPEDDLSLAAALRSPLFGWSEDALFRLACGRPGHLWPALRAARDAHPGTMAVIDDLRRAADYLRPFDLIERILTRHEGRARLLARLGREAEDAIDELLGQALAYERTGVPSLTGFLVWLDAGKVEVRRQLPATGGVLRVMTVHGAKGLEAPVVILPDTIRAAPARAGSILTPPDGPPVWAPPVPKMPPALQAARGAVLEAEARERLRLLYVAMTRAESWLIVAGAGEAKDGTWHDLIGQGLAAAGAEPVETPTGTGRRLATGDWPAWVETPDQAPKRPAPPPAWIRTRAPAPADDPAPVSPSALGGAKALPGEAGQDTEAALAHGTAVHLLLERLPPDDPDTWTDAAAASICDPALRDAALEEAGAVMRDPALARLFAPGTLAEIELAAPLPGGRTLRGAVDRLIVAPSRVLAVDFKTNAVVPGNPAEVPEGLLRQCGAYAQALAAVYPDRSVETAILWTRTGSLMPLPAAVTAAAFHRALDELGPRRGTS